MKTQTTGVSKTSVPSSVSSHVSPDAQQVRDYITEMLAELSIVAQKSGQDDLHVLLKLATQAARNSSIK